MKLFLAAIALTICSISWTGCGEPSEVVPAPATAATFAAADGSPAEQFIADASNMQESSFKVKYSTSLEVGEQPAAIQTVVWYKSADGRQRFDFSGNKDYHYFDNASVFTVGYKDRIVLCSNDLPVTPTDQDGTGPKGACCEGSSTCGDLAGNMLYFLGFPLGFANQSPQPTDEAIATLESEIDWDVSHRDVAGTAVRCYKTRKLQPDEDDDPGTIIEICFTATGAEAYYHASGEATGNVEVEAIEFATPRPEDFSYPYAVYESPNE